MNSLIIKNDVKTNFKIICAISLNTQKNIRVRTNEHKHRRTYYSSKKNIVHIIEAQITLYLNRT